jgi:hypothetical protein
MKNCLRGMAFLRLCTAICAVGRENFLGKMSIKFTKENVTPQAKP